MLINPDSIMIAMQISLDSRISHIVLYIPGNCIALDFNKWQRFLTLMFLPHCLQHAKNSCAKITDTLVSGLYISTLYKLIKIVKFMPRLINRFNLFSC